MALAALLAGALVLLAGCGSLPTDVQRPVSRALADPAGTPLAQLTAQRRPAGVAALQSGLALVDTADGAYASRLALTQSATRTLDLQYYAIHSDTSTRELLRAVRQAAARGVRVRILLDDFHATGDDAQVMRMAFVPGIEMRMFNPVPGGRGSGLLRTLSGLRDFRRTQHRMHNKLFIADNAWGITGGRNLGEAYFGQGEDSNFIDMDILAAGPVVRQMSASFDQYWNSPLAYPVESLISRDELLALREAARAANGNGNGGAQATAAAGQAPPPPAQAPRPPPDLPPAMDLRTLPLTWAPAVVLSDRPAKLTAETDAEGAREDLVIEGVLQLLERARRDVLVVSPYFVPGEQMMGVFRRLTERGVRVRVLTNSLASNDAPLAHVGYARYRQRLLALGVALYEMHALQRGMARTVVGSSGGGSRASLHAKLLVVDGRLVAVGSMNLDLRSQLQNSEVTLLIRSRPLAGEATTIVERTLAEDAWRVEATPQGGLHWHAPPGADFGDADGEPDASLGLQLLIQLLGPLAPDEML